MNKLVDKLFKGIDYFTGILTGLMVFFVFLNVVLRTFFNAGLTWSEELARYLFVYVTYIGAISAMRANAHLGVDTLISRMKPQVQMVMYIVSQTIIAILMIILVWGSEKWWHRIPPQEQQHSESHILYYILLESSQAWQLRSWR